jgi:YidC/Oxa1 family membrane protein insertase
MKFYKENGINPLGGCLPLVAQLPVFWALFNVLRAIADWQPGQVPKYGLTVPVVESAREARIFGASLADKFLFPLPHQTLQSRIVILIFVLASAATTFLTMRQSARRGMMQQTPPDPDNPAANIQANMGKYMQYIAPFFALSGLYWQFGLVIYWLTTNVWTLGQQHILFRNLPVVGSATAGASAGQPAPGGASTPGKSGAAKSGSTAKTGTTGRTGTSGKTGGTGRAKPAAQKAGANGFGGANSAVVGDTGTPASPGRGLLRFGKNKPEPEEVQDVPQAKVVRQQPVRQTRSKRSGKR